MIATHSLSALLIDDDPHDLFFLCESFNTCDYFSFVISRDTGENICTYLSTLDILPDVIISDINMPKVDGFEVLATIKSDKRFSSIPVIIFSTSSNTDDIKLAKFLGAAGFITKATCYDGVMKAAEVVHGILENKAAFHTVLV